MSLWPELKELGQKVRCLSRHVHCGGMHTLTCRHATEGKRHTNEHNNPFMSIEYFTNEHSNYPIEDWVLHLPVATPIASRQLVRTWL